MPRAIISPSVLASDFGQLTAECKRMMVGGAEWLHMDHMHTDPPHSTKWVDDIADAGGAMYCFHHEATDNPIALIEKIHSRNMKAGVAISPDTPSSAITDEVAAVADMLLVMTVYPGRGGQKFIERCVPKVAELRARFPDKDIEVDGGVGPKTIGVCADAGSNVIVAGTAIFGAEDPTSVIKQLKDTVNTAQAKFTQ
uniref:Ribulose-phosphate 3-epimerase n=1 Tax=Psilocybe cubensis TaxID=181762 RepID=A0A8H7Y6B3_PSICU